MIENDNAYFPTDFIPTYIVPTYIDTYMDKESFRVMHALHNQCNYQSTQQLIKILIEDT
jgi:hypothetical protein